MIDQAEVSHLPQQRDNICDTMAEAIRSSVGTSQTWYDALPHYWPLTLSHFLYSTITVSQPPDAVQMKVRKS